SRVRPREPVRRCACRGARRPFRGCPWSSSFRAVRDHNDRISARAPAGVATVAAGRKNDRVRRYSMKKIVLLRHGESIWNQENRFTGWKDVGLSGKGLREATAAGQLLKQEGFEFDVAYTSVLKRAIKTLWIVLEEMDRMWIPIRHSWRLNER